MSVSWRTENAARGWASLPLGGDSVTAPTLPSNDFGVGASCETVLDNPSPAPARQRPQPKERSGAERSIDALPRDALRYRNSAEYRRLLQVIRGFRESGVSISLP